MTVRIPRRRRLETLERAWHAARSRGPGYEEQPAGALVDFESIRGYFIDFRAKTTADSAGVPSLLPPAGLAQLALGWWERWLRGERPALNVFTEVCSLLEDRREDHEGASYWPYHMPVPKYALSPPWYSALAQSQVASVFVRAYAISADERHASLALAAIRPLLTDSGSVLVTRTDAGPVLEEAPTEPPSHILNGWIYGVWGLWEIATAMGEPSARSAFADGLACLRRKLDCYDVGWWTRYSLYPHRLVDLAKPFYHRLHAEQVEMLYRLTGYDDFRRAGARWHEYDRPTMRSRALLQKALFVSTR